MPPAILVPHPGGTSTPPMDRITYIPGTQITFPPRPYNSASVSPGKGHSCTSDMTNMLVFINITFKGIWVVFLIWLSFKSE